MRRLLPLVVLLLSPQVCQAEPIRAIGWNLESGGADPEFVADRIAAFDGYDVWGFSEVRAGDATDFVIASAEGEGASFDHLLGTTGGGDRLLLVWDSDRFEKTADEELMDLRAETGRAPIAVRLKEAATGAEFWVMVNHLHRTNEAKRNEQAEGVREWIKEQDVPVFALGDYNMDWDLPDGPGNEALDIILDGDEVAWVVPEPPHVKTQVAFDSILDFVFVNDEAAEWGPVSRIIAGNDFTPKSKNTDHRPVDVTFQPPTVTPEPTPFASGRTPGGLAEMRGAADGDRPRRESPERPDREEILERIERLQEQLDELRALVEDEP